jgi:hypothetical protein
MPPYTVPLAQARRDPIMGPLLEQADAAPTAAPPARMAPVMPGAPANPAQAATAALPDLAKGTRTSSSPNFLAGTMGDNADRLAQSAATRRAAAERLPDQRVMGGTGTMKITTEDGKTHVRLPQRDAGSTARIGEDGKTTITKTPVDPLHRLRADRNAELAQQNPAMLAASPGALVGPAGRRHEQDTREQLQTEANKSGGSVSYYRDVGVEDLRGRKAAMLARADTDTGKADRLYDSLGHNPMGRQFQQDANQRENGVAGAFVGEAESRGRVNDAIARVGIPGEAAAAMQPAAPSFRFNRSLYDSLVAEGRDDEARRYLDNALASIQPPGGPAPGPGGGAPAGEAPMSPVMQGGAGPTTMPTQGSAGTPQRMLHPQTGQIIMLGPNGWVDEKTGQPIR